MVLSEHRPRVTAVLGPTNTGKTHLAIERMLGHASGMIGFPLRLLARENYDRVVRVKGPRAVALITGEEKIIPPGAAYFVCTVESMPLDRAVAFLAVDEIQLAADPERGHIFTHRLLHARGLDETMFLGADTVRPLLRRLVPDATVVSRPRFSTLSYAGPRKLTRLPPRSAVVAFSATEVYGIAELVRRQRGGTAVVLGALSPRTRNAQVEMYQAGEVDYLVATDAIGMGLNMDVDHVAFANLVKFDGRSPRRLAAPEVAQIAGRAGRHMNDGTFGTTADAGVLDPEVVDAVENHRFDPLKALYWRNGELHFSSPQALLASLERPPPSGCLRRARDADDHLALAALARDPEIARLAQGGTAVRLLWEVCQIPDFRKTMTDSHLRLLGQVYRHLRGPSGRLPTDWVARHVGRIDNTEGDIDALVTRIAHIRIWTYIAHRADWVSDSAYWQGRARAVEDRLSDALHERLTHRFVDRRAATLVKRLKEQGDLMAAVSRSGEVLVEGQFVGRLEGFRFVPDAAADREGERALLSAARRALRRDIAVRVRDFVGEPDDAFGLRADGRVLWRDMAVGRVVAGETAARPRVEPLSFDLVEGELRERMRDRLQAWLDAHVAGRLAPLRKAQAAALAGAGRGLVYQLAEGLGSLPRRAVQAQLAALSPADRKQLTRAGVRFGVEAVYMPALLKPAAVALRAALWAAHRGPEPAPEVPPPGRVSVPVDPSAPAGFYEAIGYRRLGGRAIRIDIVERLAAETRRLAREGPFAATPEMLSLIGCTPEEMPAILEDLGYRRVGENGGGMFAPRQRRRSPNAPGHRQAGPKASPFAKLRELTIAQ